MLSQQVRFKSQASCERSGKELIWYFINRAANCSDICFSPSGCNEIVQYPGYANLTTYGNWTDNIGSISCEQDFSNPWKEMGGFSIPRTWTGRMILVRSGWLAYLFLPSLLIERETKTYSQLVKRRRMRPSSVVVVDYQRTSFKML